LLIIIEIKSFKTHKFQEMQQNNISKSKITNNQINTNSLIWKANDGKAQKNGPHSNIYWVKVIIYSI